MATLKSKQPREILDFDFDVSRAIGDEDAIANVTAFCTGPNQALVVENISWSDTIAKIWVSGGTDNMAYKITVLINTVAGREVEGEFILNVKDR